MLCISNEDFDRISRIIVILGSTHQVMLKYLDGDDSEVDKEVLMNLLISDLELYKAFEKDLKEINKMLENL